ncbi:MAG: DegV family protein [Eubacteriales bacterium]|nr:DegV family protein [Eubacteriales bacterium]
MKTAIMTDTNSSLTVKDGQRFGIFVMPMPVIIDDICCCEGRDITYEDLWKAFEEEKDVHTSMPSTGDLMDEWNRILNEEGYDEVVYIPMSSGLSGGCWAAAAASAEFDGRVHVVDNHRISYTLMNSVFDALELANNGKRGAEIKAELEKDAFLSSIYITVNSVRYLVKSGRVTPAAANIANILHLKPVLQIQGDKLDAFAKAHGMNAACDKMIAAIRKDIDTRFSGVPMERLSIGTAGTLRTDTERESWRRRIEESFPGSHVMYRPLSCSIACHVGTDAVGTAVSIVNYDQDKLYI